ncbi:DUF3558 family protein [Nocardia grenadensis]|uniref:DUF3558 family protein n=1 Tax=Nocardia grenadensis TaxID=931537 RepID=UPI003D92D52C
MERAVAANGGCGGDTVSIPTRKGTGLPRFTRRHLAAIAPVAAAVLLAGAGCSSADNGTSPTTPPATSPASAANSTTAAAPSVSPVSGLDICALLTSDEVADILGTPGLAPQRTINDKTGRVVAESCNWGTETAGLVSVSWMHEPIPAWGEDAQSRAFGDAIGLRVAVNAWAGKGCTVFAEKTGGNIGINIIPSDKYLTERPSSPGDDICDRNKSTIVAAFERARPA